MSWEIHPLDGALGPWREAWDGLNSRLYRSNPYYDSRFVDPLLGHFGSGQERLCVHTRAGRVDGMLILTPRRFGAWSSFLPSQAQVAPLLLEHPDDLGELFTVLPGWVWVLDLLNQDPDYSTCQDRGDGGDREWSDHALTIKVALDGTFDEYWGARSKNLQKNIKRYINRARNEGNNPLLAHHATPVEVSRALVRYGELESAGWKGEAGTAIRHNNEQGYFYQDVLARFAASGNASIYELYFGERLVASRLCITCGEMLIILKTTYDESMSAYAPGRVLLYHVLRREFELKRTRAIEFYTNATPDQRQWSTQERQIRHLTLFRGEAVRSAHKRLKRLREGIQAVKALASGLGDGQAAGGFKLSDFDMREALPAPVVEAFNQAERLYPEWGLDWFRHIALTALPEGQQARCLVLERDAAAAPAVVLPMRLEPRRNTLHALTTFYSSLFAPLAENDDAELALARMFAEMARGRRHWNILYLFPMDRNAPVFAQTVAALKRAGWLAYPYFGFGNWYLPARGMSFADYFLDRSSRLRHTYARKERKFHADGRGRLAMIQDAAELDRAIAAYEKIYRASWKTPEPYPDFMPGLIRLCAQRGWLRLGLAYYDDTPVAVQVWIVSHKRACIYKLAYDETFAHLSAGTVLSMYLMRHVLDVDRVEEVDYLIGDDPYKSDWMTHRRERWGIVAYNPRTAVGLWGAARETTARAAKNLLTRLTDGSRVQQGNE